MGRGCPGLCEPGKGRPDMTISKALEEIQTVFLDTAPVIYFIEAHHQFGPLVKEVVELMNENRIQAFTSVLTLSEVLPKKPKRFGSICKIDDLVKRRKIQIMSFRPKGEILK